MKLKILPYMIKEEYDTNHIMNKVYNYNINKIIDKIHNSKEIKQLMIILSTINDIEERKSFLSLLLKLTDVNVQLIDDFLTIFEKS